MSNNDMVMVPRELLEQVTCIDEFSRHEARKAIVEILSLPAQQHQGEPVAEFGHDCIFNLRKQPNGERWPVGTKLYTHADPAEK